MVVLHLAHYVQMNDCYERTAEIRCMIKALLKSWCVKQQRAGRSLLFPKHSC